MTTLKPVPFHGKHSLNANFKFKNVHNCPLLKKVLKYLAHNPLATRKQILAACNDPGRVYNLEYANHEILPAATDYGFIYPVGRDRQGYRFALTAKGAATIEKLSITIKD